MFVFSSFDLSIIFVVKPYNSILGISRGEAVITYNLTKKPRNVVIFGHKIKISYKKKLFDFGQFYGDDNEIYIRSDDKWREHLLHEIFHAILFYSGHSEKFKDNEEEALVRALESGMKTLLFF